MTGGRISASLVITNTGKHDGHLMPDGFWLGFRLMCRVYHPLIPFLLFIQYNLGTRNVKLMLVKKPTF